MDYTRRLVDDELDDLLATLPAISLEGPKAVGKTATARRRAQTIFAMDQPAAREVVGADPEVIVAAARPVMIDEWQRAPESWDLVRRAVDDGAPAGAFLLTGSAAPTNPPTHSGAGRIVRVRLRPMSLLERGVSTGEVSLRSLLDDGGVAIGGRTDMTFADYAEQIVASGLPGLRGLASRARQLQLDGYLERVIDRDFAEQGRPVRRPNTLRAWLAAYAAATATTASYNAILDAATPGESNKPAKTTTIAYREVLSQLWLLDPLPAWSPVANPFTRLAEAPKHHLADPALAARLLGVGVDELRSGAAGNVGFHPGTRPVGPLFESLLALDLRVYAQAIDARVGHLRTRNGDHEVDFVVEGAGGRVVAFEVKASPAVSDDDVKHLRWLRDRLGDRLSAACVITTGPYAYRRPDGIGVIPAALLGP